MRKRGAKFKPNTCTVNPLFALAIASRNKLATPERVAMDALLDHKAEQKHIDCLETLVETSIRAVGLAKTECPHLSHEDLRGSMLVFHRAALALVNAKERHRSTGIYGLNGEDRLAMIEADQLIGDLRKPGVILRKTWLHAFRQAVHGQGVKIPGRAELDREAVPA